MWTFQHLETCHFYDTNYAYTLYLDVDSQVACFWQSECFVLAMLKFDYVVVSDFA